MPADYAAFKTLSDLNSSKKDPQIRAQELFKIV
jgi:hypothetical protein